jgi:hypothetical protein
VNSRARSRRRGGDLGRRQPHRAPKSNTQSSDPSRVSTKGAHRTQSQHASGRAVRVWGKGADRAESQHASGRAVRVWGKGAGGAERQHASRAGGSCVGEGCWGCRKATRTGGNELACGEGVVMAAEGDTGGWLRPRVLAKGVRGGGRRRGRAVVGSCGEERLKDASVRSSHAVRHADRART